jgi:hypothetical protein
MNLETINRIAVPKGDNGKGTNRELAGLWLADQGIELPAFAGRLLHSRSRWIPVSFMQG